VAQRIVQFSSISTRDLLVYFAGDEIRRTLPAWGTAFFALDRKLKGGLSASLRAYADADMNVLKAAAALSVHPNTIYSRFEKISDISGLDPRTFHALGELLLLIDCWRE
jgi:sugar diacid utilization regulator